MDLSKFINEILRKSDLTWDIIQKYSALPWPTSVLSRLAPLDYIEDHPDIPWDFSAISGRKDLTIDFMRRYKDKLNWNYISNNIDFQDVIENPHLPWNYRLLSYNTNIKAEDLIEHPDLPWDYFQLSYHINLDFVYANPDLMWDYDELSSRPLCLDFIRQNINKSWDYKELSKNPNMTFDFAVEFYDKPWNWKFLIKNSNIDDIIKYL